MVEVLRHRIRAASLLVAEQHTPLAHHEVNGNIYWIPPDGGFGPECDESTKDIVRRELSEEIGLWVDVGPPVYVREFIEPAAGRFHTKLFYRIDAWRGESTLANLEGLDDDGFDIHEVDWTVRDELSSLPSFYPAELADDAWPRLDAPMPSTCYLGLQCQTLIVSDRWWGSRGLPSALRLWGAPGSAPWAGSTAGTSADRCAISYPSGITQLKSR